MKLLSNMSGAFILCAALATAAPAQNPSTKIGAINLRQAIVSTAEGKKASAQIDAEFSARKNELESLSRQINEIQQRLSSAANTLSEEERERLTFAVSAFPSSSSASKTNFRKTSTTPRATLSPASTANC